MRRILLLTALLLCGSLYAQTAVSAAWIGGSCYPNRPEVTGTLGVPDPNNVPGARSSNVWWIDSTANIWLFGAKNCDVGRKVYFSNDLWKFDGINWTWIGGLTEPESPWKLFKGVYGTRGQPDPNNLPPGRAGAISWTDNEDNLWLFGGLGCREGTQYYCYNDLWKFDGTNWTWVSGANTFDQPGVYGTKGIADPANVPGARTGSVSWIDTEGNLYLFGGHNSAHYFNDLWKFDGTNWTWVSGSNQTDRPGNYGEKGVPMSSNMPGARDANVTWLDSANNLWLFGGHTYGSYYNDLWRFDGTYWTWMSGSRFQNNAGNYGNKGVSDAANVPGAREGSASWIDQNGNLWLFGGYLFYGPNELNDIWKFDGTNWTWVGGSSSPNQPAAFGIKGVPDIANTPGARMGSFSWTDANDGLWLFGGGAYYDLWRFDVYTNYDLYDFDSFASAWLAEIGQANFDSAWDISTPADNRIDLLDLQVFCQSWLLD